MDRLDARGQAAPPAPFRSRLLNRPELAVDEWYGDDDDDDDQNMASPSLHQSRQDGALGKSWPTNFSESVKDLTEISPALRQKIHDELRLDQGSEAEEQAMSYSLVQDPLLMTWDPLLKQFKAGPRAVNLLPKPSSKREAHLAFTYIMDSLAALVHTLEDVKHKAGHDKPVDRLDVTQLKALNDYDE